MPVGAGSTMEVGKWKPMMASKAPWEHRQPLFRVGPDCLEMGFADTQQRGEELRELWSAQLAMQIFQNTRRGLDLDREATVYEFPVGLLSLPCNMPKPEEALKPLADLRAMLGRKLAQQKGSKPILVTVHGKESLGVCLVRAHSFDQKSCSAAVISMANPNQAHLRVKIEELRKV